MSPTLSAIYIYPIKSCRGIAVDAASLTAWGLEYDRNWMVVNPAGRFLTQRELPRMALIETAIADNSLSLDAPGQDGLAIPLDLTTGNPTEVEVWGDRCMAIDQGAAVAQWLSRFLGIDCRLVRMGSQYDRPTNPKYAENAQVSFADGYPFLVISEASLADLNQRLPETIPMNRFRPNLVVTGCEAYAEDSWKQILVDQVAFDVVKPCARCVITTTDQATATRSGTEPLKTLSSYRRNGKDVLFGQNLVHRGIGELRVGSAIEVVQSTS